ncbi:hypothetical protein L1987_58740 [Smallanthus sonchifolius]|uniref:Uncharacterized protein n=1 Tax=Smallanthus sonchifolius TaxID=185202 RepID=A0ACB9D3M5_9ASTR|nr:hypothetical protein L1987_58740 [Smallanthus sonchifolius]
MWVLFFPVFIGNFLLASAQDDFWGQYCGSDNYTHSSAHKRNLDDVLYLLTGTNNGFGFYNSTSGQANPAALSTCGFCFFQFSSAIFFSPPLKMISGDSTAVPITTRIAQPTNETWTTVSSIFINTNNVPDSSYDQWNQTVADLLGELRPEAAGGGQLRKYASRNVTAPGLGTIYGMMQCTPDLSARECNDCLATATDRIRPYSRSLGVRIYTIRCHIRYETYPFFNSTWSPAQSTSGPLLPGFQVGFRNGSTKGITHEMEDDDSGEMNSFNLSTMEIATNNFSLENKLGEGGFGPVYRVTYHFHDP